MPCRRRHRGREGGPWNKHPPKAGAGRCAPAVDPALKRPNVFPRSRRRAALKAPCPDGLNDVRKAEKWT